MLAAPLSTTTNDAGQGEFTPDEFRARRERVFDAIGDQALAVIQGAAGVSTFYRFRQTNEFYYLSGVESPGATMLLDGRTRRTSIYLPHRDAHREQNEGKVPSAEDAEEMRGLTGADAVAGSEHLALDLAFTLWRSGAPSIMYTPMSPGEGVAATRDMLLVGIADAANDPWDGGPTRTGRFVRLLQDRFPQLSLRDLSPILDRLRLYKSPAEIARMRSAARLCGLGVIEAMKSTQPGISEYHLGAVAQFVFMAGGSQGEGYRAIVASGANTMRGHYYRNDSVLREGDLILMDYAPDYRYFTSDIGRMWPVSGHFLPYQRQLYDYVVAYHRELLARIHPGATFDEVNAGAEAAMRTKLEGMRFEKPEYEAAARRALGVKGFLSHSVGMAVHDVGDYRNEPFAPGLVFSVDPGLAVFEENFSIRVEDTVVVTQEGIENLTGFVPIDADEIEALMTKPGILQMLWSSAPPPAV